jgi:transmembrane sensor
MAGRERALPGGTVTEQAAAWFLRLNEPSCSDEDRRAFDAWLDASDRHAEEYRRFQHLWRRLDGIPGAKPAGRPGRVAAFAAALALGLGLMIGRHLSGHDDVTEETIATAIGETRQVVLADGTQVNLNTDSRLVVTFDSQTRRIRVERGEALFAVARDPARSFEVQAGTGVLCDIGTTFDVALVGEHVTVGVIEGAVEVHLAGYAAKAVVGGGEQIAYSPDGLSRPRRFDGEAETAWRSGRFVFHETPLSDVVEQLNRHHPRQTVLADGRLARLRVSGAFRTADREGLLTAIEALYPVRREEAGAETRLVPKTRH